MSGPSIQPIASVKSQAAPLTAASAGSASTPAGPAAAPKTLVPAVPAAAAVELDLSALARALDKLAQAPGVDAKMLAQLMTLIKGQGELLGLLGALGGRDPQARSRRSRSRRHCSRWPRCC